MLSGASRQVQWKSDGLTSFDPEDLLVEDDVFAQPGLELVKGELASNDHWGMFSYAFYQQIEKNAPEFEQLTAFQAGGMVLSVRRAEADRLAKPLRGEYVSGNYFSTFGVGASAGRTLAPSDDQDGAAPAAVMSYRTWQQQYGSDPGVVGSVFIMDGRPITIVGIGPRGFFGETLRSDPPDLWVPLHQEPVLVGGLPCCAGALPRGCA
jgi:hypothetical protein